MMPMDRLKNTVPSSDVLKRVVDCVGAGLLMLLMWPVLGVSVLAILVDSGRPVFFTQQRAGKHGIPFTVYKLRTLHIQTHNPTLPQALATRVGRVLRRWAIDELPQLWNVLKGDMSLVGPRPTLLDQVAHYSAYERRRLEVRPGLTGWAQVNGRNALSWPERIRLDVWYADNQSFWLDVRILLRTPLVLLAGEGVYGQAGRNESFGPTEPPTEPAAP